MKQWCVVQVVRDGNAPNRTKETILSKHNKDVTAACDYAKALRSRKGGPVGAMYLVMLKETDPVKK